MADTANSVYRDFVTDGVPASGKHEPYKPDIRRLLTGYEQIISAFLSNGGLIYSSKAALDADLARGANSMAWVLGDPVAANNGIYRKDGAPGTGSWTRVSDLPFSFIIASDVGAGTANAIQATTSIPVSSSALVWMNIYEANTGPVSVSFNGGAPLAIKTNTGSDPVPGGLVAGMIVLGVASGGAFRLVSDQASASIVAAAEGWANVAQAAANGNLTFATRAAASSAIISASIHSVTLKGDASEGDGLGGMFIDADNGSTDTFISADGRTWRRVRDVSLARLSSELQSSANVVMTVGSGGNFSTINAALTAASKLAIRVYKSMGFTVELRLLTGFVMNEQVLVSGIDLSFITITAVDSVTYINPAGVTAQLEGTDSGEPAFGATKGGRLPNIGAQFEYQTQQTGTKRGVAVFYGSKVRFVAGSGVRKSAGGLLVYYDSEASVGIPGLRNSNVAFTQYGVDFSNTEGRALDVHNGSRVSLPRSLFNNSGSSATDDPAVYGIWGVEIDILQSQIKGAKATASTSAAVRIRDGSKACCRECDVSGSAGNGYYFSHATVADCRFDPGGVMASAGASNCALIGLQADGGCSVDATSLIATNCGVAGVLSESASIVTAAGAIVSNSLGEGFFARNTGTIAAHGGIANNCAFRGVYALGSSTIGFEGGSATGCDVAILSHRGSRVHAEGAICTGYTTNGLSANRGSHISAYGASCRKAGSNTATDIAVAGGSTIQANTATGGVSQAANTLTASGIIFV